MPEFCPPDYLPPSANSGERQQFFSGNGRDWQQECFPGGEGTGGRWQQVSAEIWTNRGDLPPVLADFVTRQQQAIEQADKLDPKLILNNVQAGFDRKMQVDLQIASSLARIESPPSGLKDAQNKQDWENWNNYKDYLAPAGKRASMGFALISSGIDRHIEEGEKMLVEAVRLRPELQFNEDFQKRVVQSYKDMARTRIDIGLPMYKGAPQLEPINSGRQPILGTDPAQPLLADARKQGQERGVKGATEQYDKAITESDNKDFSTIKNVRLATFVQRLMLDRTIIESEERGIPSGYMRNQRRMAADREEMVYNRYMSPGKVRSEAAFDMIASGDPQMFDRGKKLLGDALKLRPELEFSEKFNRDKQAAFQQHFRNAQNTDGSKVPSPPSKPQRNSDGKTYSMPFPAKAEGLKLPPFLVPQKQAEPPAKQPEKGGTVPGAGTGSDSPPAKVIDVNKPVASQIAGADSTVPYKELPAGNPFDKSKGYSQKDIEDLTAKGIVALLLAGGAYKLIKKGNEYFFEKQKPAENAKPAEDAKTNEEARAKLEADSRVDKAQITRLQQELDANKQAREQEKTKSAEERRANNETIEKLRGDIAKAETDRQAEVAKHAAEIEKLNTARQSDIENTHAEGLAAIERLTGTHNEDISRITGEKDAVIQQQKSAIERIEAALADANKARDAERTAADTQRQQLETSLRESEQARTTEGEQSKANLEQSAEQLRSAQGENAGLKKQNSGLQTELDTARTTNTSLQSQLEETNRKSITQQADIERIQREGLAEIERLTGSNKAEVARITGEKDAEIERHKSATERVEAALTDANKARETAEGRNVTLQTNLTETEAKRTASDNKVTDLTTALQQSEQTRAGENEKATAEQARLQQLLQTSEAGKTASDTKVQTLEGELETARAERDRVTVLAKGDRAQLEANIRSLTEQLQKATEDKTALENSAGETSETQQRQIAELQRRLAEATGKLTEREGTLADNERKLAQATTDNQQKDDALARLKAEHERQLSELTKRAEQAEQARLAAEQGRETAEQGRQAAEQQRASERTRAESAEKERDTARGELTAERFRIAAANPADVKAADVDPANVKAVEIKSADTKIADAEPARVEVPQTTEQPTAPRRRIRGGAVQLDTAVIAQNEGNGTFSREVAQGAGIDGTPESKGEKISADQVQLVKEEIQRLKETKIAADETKAKNLERVLSIIERTDSPRVQEAAHKYIASRILDGESRHAEAGGGARAAIGRGVSAGIVVSAFLSYYTMREEMLRKGEEFETSASVGSSKK
jgi:hypothetical protein